MHTCYSLLDGACRIPRLVSRAKELGQSALAITDHGVMFGVVEFYKTCVAEGIKPILGCEVYVAPRSRFDKSYDHDYKSHHLVLLAKDNAGYKNLLRLVSLAHVEGFYNKPRVDKELLQECSGGLIALSACLSGEIASAVAMGNEGEARRVAEWYKSVFGGDYYIELQDTDVKGQRRYNSVMAQMAQELDIPLVATNDVHYVEQEDAYYQDVLMCIQTGSNLSDNDRLRYDTDQLYLKSGDEMSQLFPDLPQAIANTTKIAADCNVTLQFWEGDTSKLNLPKYALPENTDAFSHISMLCYDGLSKRYGDNVTKQHTKRLHFELNTIKQMGFIDYMLIVRDFIAFAKGEGIPVVPGRGSVGGSLVAYLLGITDICPLRHGLLFERFLNPERVSMPDIDIDFCYERRHEVIDYVVRKYGKQHVAQIITFGTMQARLAVRDVGRVLGIPYYKVDAVAKQIPFAIGQTIDHALEQNAQLREEYTSDETVRRLIDTARQIEGMPRHTSTHAAGVVITAEPILECVPLALAEENVVTQISMGGLEELGLLKMDFLGSRNLTTIRKTVDNLRDDGVYIDINKLDYADPKAFEMISRGDTDGVFQLESAGMRQFMRELKPRELSDIVAGIALHRPGPMEYIPRYIQNRANPENVRYHHPLLEPILRETFGCIVYQEQVMQVVQSLAGYSLGRADILRRAMSKKKAGVMEREMRTFIHGDDEIDGAVKRGIPEEIAAKIYNEMADFAKYAFNKSHSVGYAMIVYQTAYLKANYPLHFMACLMSTEIGSSSKVARYTAECKRLGIKVGTADVNQSEVRFTAAHGEITFALAAIKNIGSGLAHEIVKERSLDGNYTSFTNFCTRIAPKGLNRRALECLILCGAFDCLGGRRSQYMAIAAQTLEDESAKARQNLSGQLTLFGGETSTDQLPPNLREYDRQYMLSMEKELTGVYISGHPLDEYIKDYHTFDKIDDILEDSDAEMSYDGKTVTIMAVIQKRTAKVTKKDEQMATLVIEDLTASIETLVFPKALMKYNDLIGEGSIAIITARVDIKEQGNVILIMDKATPVAVEKRLFVKVTDIPSEQAFAKIKPLLAKHPGASQVILHFPAQKQTFAAPAVTINRELTDELHRLLGNNCEIVIK